MQIILPPVRFVAFDLDGTLVEGMPYEAVLQHVAELTEITFKELLRRYREEWKDLEEAKAFHLSLASRANADQIRMTYATFRTMKSSPTVFPWSARALQAARGLLNAKNICWTRGSAKLQHGTIRTSGLGEHFSHIIVAGQKNQETFTSDVLPFLCGEPFAMIGDSYAQDIESVADLAAYRIWIAGSKMNAFLPEPALIDPDVIRVNSIADVYTLFTKQPR